MKTRGNEKVRFVMQVPQIDMRHVKQTGLFHHLIHGITDMINEFSHLIEMNYEENKITIYRVFSDGERQLYTSTNFPAINFDRNKEEFFLFAQNLGENILLDSPAARKIFGLE